MAFRDVVAKAADIIFGSPRPRVSIEFGEQFKATVMGMSPDELFRTQPYLRTVVTFLARNIAQLGLHGFERVSDTDRRRVHDDPLVRLLKRPNSYMTTYDLVFSIVANVALYDEFVAAVLVDSKSDSGWTIQPIDPMWIVKRGGASAFTVEWIEFQRPGSTDKVRMNIEDLLWIKGWNPGNPRYGSSPVESLKQILSEQISAQVFRQQMWARGGRIGGYLTRPQGATWDAETRNRFQTQWQAKFAGNTAAAAGATPILEDGMTYQKERFNAHEEEFVEGSKLALSTVASVYHVNPTMVGLLDNANFSNVKEFRSMLYGDTLGSTISMLEDALNTFLVPRVATTDGLYLEFNIAEKLQGSFEEQAAALQSSVGRPWMTADEARAKQNMPALGGDAAQLVTPLNVLVGGQASARDSAPKGKSALAVETARTEVPKSTSALGPRAIKADDVDTDPYRKKAEEVLAAFFRRQRGVVLSRLGAKAAPDWWDQERWDRELADDLYRVNVASSTSIARAQAELIGFAADEYDEDRTLAFLKAVAESRAGAVNSTTLDRLKKALDADEDPAGVFDEAESARSESGAAALIAAVAGFALVEVGKQLIGDNGRKTWITGDNPRPEHAAMDGETVPLSEKFSNGAEWPGDPVLGADGVAGCNCGVSIEF